MRNVWAVGDACMQMMKEGKGRMFVSFWNKVHGFMGCREVGLIEGRCFVLPLSIDVRPMVERGKNAYAQMGLKESDLALSASRVSHHPAGSYCQIWLKRGTKR